MKYWLKKINRLKTNRVGLIALLCVIVITISMASCSQSNKNSFAKSESSENMFTNKKNSNSTMTAYNSSNINTNGDDVNITNNVAKTLQTNSTKTQSISSRPSSDKTVNNKPKDNTTSTTYLETSEPNVSKYKPAPTNVFPITDLYGMRGINVLGDSVSHGANAPDIPKQSYIGIMKKQLDNEYKGGNYGFVSLLHKIDNNSGVYREIHNVGKKGSWQTIQDGEILGFYAFSSNKKNDTIYIKPKEHFNYFAIFYQEIQNGGVFDIFINDKKVETVNTKSAQRNSAARTKLIKANTDDIYQIKVVNSNGKEITISGVGYYNYDKGAVINNYSRSGLQLIQVDDEILEKIAQTSILIVSIGHNDMFQSNVEERFKKKIDVIIKAVNKNKCTLIVNDFTWGEKQGEVVRKHLKRLATTCNGTYNDFTESMNGKIQDGSHPYPSGHQVLAETMLKNIGL